MGIRKPLLVYRSGKVGLNPRCKKSKSQGSNPKNKSQKPKMGQFFAGTIQSELLLTMDAHG
jgi:hypothetical protein